MRGERVLVLLASAAALIALLPVSSVAQDWQFYLSPLVSQIEENAEKGYRDEGGWTLGFGAEFRPGWNIEAYLQRVDPAGTAGQDQTAYGVDLQRVFRHEARWRPYLFIGLGVLDAELDGSPQSDRSGTASLGVGVLARVFGNSLAGLRAEYRYRHDDTFSGGGDDGIFSLGLHLPFGRAETPPPPARIAGPAVDPDLDADGVLNAADRCPNTPLGTEVDAFGCEADDDRDGVVNRLDRCPDTLAGAVVGRDGCELDDDRDEVVNRLDRCPGTTFGVAVDVFGCEIRDEIELPGVTFASNSDQLLPEAVTVLENAAQTLRNNPSITVEVAGHTDSQGAADYNQQLSERRAIAVRDYFIGRGIDAARLTARGYGEAQPVADNATAGGRALNRRVVLRILSR